MLSNRHSRLFVAVSAGLLVLGACGSTDNSSTHTGVDENPASGTVTLTNCDVELTYDTPVERIVATSNSANIGTLLRIGAVDQLQAVALSEGNNAVMTSLFGPGIEDVPRLQTPISLEAIVAEDPDLLIGSYSGLFAGSTGVTVEAANEQDIDTYVISDSCRQDPDEGSSSALGTMDPWDAVRADLENYGALTGNEDEAAAALDEFNDRLAALADAPQPDEAPRILLFDSGTDDIFTSGRNGPPQGIIEAAGGENIFDSEDTTWFRASWEAVAQAEPDAIVVMDYRSDDTNEVDSKLATLRDQPSLSSLPVIDEDRIIVLPLALFTSGYGNIEAAEQVRAGLERLGLLPQSDIVGELPEEFRR